MNEVLTVIQETEILGKKIKVYDNIETPLFLASDVADWIEHSQTSKMVKSVDDDEKLMGTLFLSGQNRDACLLIVIYQRIFEKQNLKSVAINMVI